MFYLSGVRSIHLRPGLTLYNTWAWASVDLSQGAVTVGAKAVPIPHTTPPTPIPNPPPPEMCDFAGAELGQSVCRLIG
ncbi:hypothetical protein AAFF_G00347740 [Aldrovandia affinis]|uniref:Uncharacterized protein n=1 Tax=Aldrovandia affinis TaxID=143900 RepID=A0AAD7SJS5_9TELE|nr:hypothetical protein AAFF_G00347740 [Aldrovandia affinis]